MDLWFQKSSRGKSPRSSVRSPHQQTKSKNVDEVSSKSDLWLPNQSRNELPTMTELSNNLEEQQMTAIPLDSIYPTLYEPRLQRPEVNEDVIIPCKSVEYNIQLPPWSDIPSDDCDARELFTNESIFNEPIPIISSVNSSKSVRKCADCKKAPHMQCLHCSQYVCMECAQKHFAIATEQIDVAQHIMNDKMNIIDHLATAAKERVNAEHKKIIKQADIERDQAFFQIDQIAEQQKKQIRDKSVQLSEQSLDEIPSFIQQITSEMEYVNESNTQLFNVNSILPKIQVQLLNTNNKI